MSIVHHEPEMKIVQLSTNQRWVLSTINQSEISIVYYQPIRDKYYKPSVISTHEVRLQEVASATVILKHESKY